MQRRAFLGGLVFGAIGAALACSDNFDTVVGLRPNESKGSNAQAPLDAATMHLALSRAGVRDEDIAYGFALAVLARDLLVDSADGKLARSDFDGWVRKTGYSGLDLEQDAIEVKAIMALGNPEVRAAVYSAGPGSIGAIARAIELAVGTPGAGPIKTRFEPELSSPAVSDALWVMSHPDAAEHVPSTPRVEQYVERIVTGLSGDDLVKQSSLTPTQLRQLLRVSISRQMGLITQPLT